MKKVSEVARKGRAKRKKNDRPYLTGGPRQRGGDDKFFTSRVSKPLPMRGRRSSYQQNKSIEGSRTVSIGNPLSSASRDKLAARGRNRLLRALHSWRGEGQKRYPGPVETARQKKNFGGAVLRRTLIREGEKHNAGQKSSRASPDGEEGFSATSRKTWPIFFLTIAWGRRRGEAAVAGARYLQRKTIRQRAHRQTWQRKEWP